MNMRKLGGLVAAIAVPLVVMAASSAKQDFLDASNATPDPDRGYRLFGGCVNCHGGDGGGEVNGNAPRLAGQHRLVVIRQLVDYRYDDRRDPRMESVTTGHRLQSAQDMADVAEFIASLQPRTPAGQGPGTRLEQGRKTYSDRCSTCHGKSGQGEAAILIPRLGGQHYAYLLRQFHDALEGRRPQLARTHAAYLQDLDRDVLQGVADAVSRMSGLPQK